MTREDIQTKMQEVFRDVFDDETIDLTDDMTSDDIEDWDSLSHITLVHELEAAFNIRFTTKEILSAKDVGEFTDTIASKIS